MNATQFFYDNAGFSYDPKTETAEAGHWRSAQELANAEAWGRDAGLCFHWTIDPVTDSSDWTDGEPYAVWLCTAYDESGTIVASLGAVDFGPDGEPWGQPYRRVVEAELALEVKTRQ